MSRLALLDRLGLFGGDTASLCSLPEGYFDAPAQLTRLEPRVRGLEGGTMVNGTATVLSFPPRR